MTHILALSSYLQSPIEGLINILTSLNQKLKDDADFRVTVKELSRLSDRELRDIGLSRSDIYTIARGDSTMRKGVR